MEKAKRDEDNGEHRDSKIPRIRVQGFPRPFSDNGRGRKACAGSLHEPGGSERQDRTMRVYEDERERKVLNRDMVILAHTTNAFNKSEA